MPHGMCYLWEPALIRLHFYSNLGIALAYFAIPVALIYLFSRRSVIFSKIYLGFAAFITLCGLTHVFDMITIYYPWYWVDGYLRVATAVVSIVVAGILIRGLPQALTYRTQVKEELTRKAEARLAELAENEAVLRRQLVDRMMEVNVLKQALQLERTKSQG